MHTILALVLWLAVPSLPWYEHYDRGVRLIEQGQGAAAREHLARSDDAGVASKR